MKLFLIILLGWTNVARAQTLDRTFLWYQGIERSGMVLKDDGDRGTATGDQLCYHMAIIINAMTLPVDRPKLTMMCISYTENRLFEIRCLNTACY